MKAYPRMYMKTNEIKFDFYQIHLDPRMSMINKPLIAARPEC